MPVRQMHREVFFAHNGPGPYLCLGCGSLVYFYDEFTVHHVDEDARNNAPGNLAALHRGCHSRLHRTGSIQSDEARAKMSVAKKGRVNSPAHRAAIAKAGRERVWSDETRAKISAAHKGRTKTPEHRRKIADTLRANHARKEIGEAQ